MRTTTWAARAAGIALVLLAAASSAQAQVAKFSKIRDAVPLKYFDAALTKPDPSNLNRLIIGFSTGVDPLTLGPNDFRAWFARRSGTSNACATGTRPPTTRTGRPTRRHRG